MRKLPIPNISAQLRLEDEVINKLAWQEALLHKKRKK